MLAFYHIGVGFSARRAPLAEEAAPSEEVAPPEEPEGKAPAESLAPAIDWERWIGVRGAAVVGAAILGLAGLLFLKYSIEHGLIPPAVRVAAGLLAGAGVVLLYASVWAARTLYALIGSGFAFVLMVLVTVACGVLSWRHRSRVIAVLGLAGGFATPALAC